MCKKCRYRFYFLRHAEKPHLIGLSVWLIGLLLACCLRAVALLTQDHCHVNKIGMSVFRITKPYVEVNGRGCDVMNLFEYRTLCVVRLKSRVACWRLSVFSLCTGFQVSNIMSLNCGKLRGLSFFVRGVRFSIVLTGEVRMLASLKVYCLPVLISDDLFVRNFTLLDMSDFCLLNLYFQ